MDGGSKLDNHEVVEEREDSSDEGRNIADDNEDEDELKVIVVLDLKLHHGCYSDRHQIQPEVHRQGWV